MEIMAATEFLARSTTQTSVGWIGYIIIGAIAGWIAGKIVKGSGSGILVNIVVGVIGALIGLFLIIQETYFGIPMLTWGLMAVICGYCAYHAVGKGGYIALLAAVTVVITAGHGEQNVYDALWRTVDVLIGTAIALVFSFAFPAYASYSWRFKLAALLRGCAAVHAKIERGERDEKARQQDMMNLSNLLVQMRSLIPSVAKETSVPAAEALFAASGPATPSIAPLPNSSGCLASAFSVE